MKAAEQQYWREREFVLDLLDNLPYSIFWKSRDSVFLGCNHLFAQTAGLDDPQDIVGKTDYDLPWSDGESEAYREDDQYVMDNRISKLDIEESQTLSDGSKIVLLTSKVPLLDKYDNVIGVLCIYTDITERKRMEDELRIAKEQAEASSIAKTEFLSNMSHDIRTPLSGIIGMAEMLAQKLEDPVFQEAADSILISGCHLMSFFDNCLELSRLESADITLLKEYFSLRETVDSVKGLFQAAINGKGLTLNIHISEDVPNIVVSSRVSIYRTLQNLVGNAIKFTDVGSITINVGVEESWTEHDTVVRLSVEDTGIGIASDKQEVIFEKMSRLTPSYEATYEGSGMGLYIVKRFISAMGGQVSLESTLGKGSTFTILFPVSVPVPQDNEMFASHLPNQLKGVGKAFESLSLIHI